MANEEENFDEFLKKKKRKFPFKWVFILFVLLFFAGLIIVSADWVMSALVHTRKEVSVPDLSKKSVTQALDLLAQQNLALKQAGMEFAGDVPPGSVLRQIPSAGSTVREGRVIRVWISQGDEMAFIPNIVGKSLRDAQLAIRQAGLRVGKVENAYSITYEKGLIISQTPKADNLVQKGESVSFILSSGVPPASVVIVPNFKGKKLAQATLWASAQNINLIIKEDPYSVFPSGLISEQKPAADKQIAPGANLEVVVSRRQATENEKTYRLHYEMPQGKKSSRVLITLNDDMGETEVLNETKNPGSKIDLEIPYIGKGTLRIMVDGILVREREVL